MINVLSYYNPTITELSMCRHLGGMLASEDRFYTPPPPRGGGV